VVEGTYALGPGMGKGSGTTSATGEGEGEGTGEGTDEGNKGGVGDGVGLGTGEGMAVGEDAGSEPGVGVRSIAEVDDAAVISAEDPGESESKTATAEGSTGGSCKRGLVGEGKGVETEFQAAIAGGSAKKRCPTVHPITATSRSNTPKVGSPTSTCRSPRKPGEPGGEDFNDEVAPFPEAATAGRAAMRRHAHSSAA